MNDSTEQTRRQLLVQINTEPGSREALEAQHGQGWDTTQLGQDYEAIGFLAPFIVVRRKADRAKGTLQFQHSPRFYFSFVAEEPPSPR